MVADEKHNDDGKKYSNLTSELPFRSLVCLSTANCLHICLVPMSKKKKTLFTTTIEN